MSTFNALRDPSGELTLVATGMASAPVVIDRDSGASVTLRPTYIDTSLNGFGCVSLGVGEGPPPERANGWYGELPIDRAATEARLTLVADGVARNATVRWPEPPAPVHAPMKRQSLKKSSRTRSATK